MRVAIVEAVPAQSPAQPSLDDRTSAIARTGVRILGNLGVWPLLKEAPSPIHAVEISERGCFGGARIDAAAQGLDSLGSVVRNRVLGEALWDRLRAKRSEGVSPSTRARRPRSPGLPQGNVDIFCPARVTAVSAEDDHISARVEGEGRCEGAHNQGAAIGSGGRSTLVVAGCIRHCR